MWGAGSQSPWDFDSQSQGGRFGFSQESEGFGLSQSGGLSQSQQFDLSQSQYGQSLSQSKGYGGASPGAVPVCTECQSTEMSTTDDGDMVRKSGTV